ncbi:beta-glucosidase [Caldicoprobacter guelmensis]|uniref:glycoside hydrolase family 3 C-terminal domain-containing protein n=1 Tax=Caldicoprobacter guelmensis TaxID=1170224 RepID=UPI001957522E|nr:glycoside hydrolase family 3 C-terminal domain-containing protein [Caldicoprobacter guelmensis]MBM7582919.1 beta-glucosidase [Caldicoprobacter guelmensis]
MSENIKQNEDSGIPIYLDPDQPLEKRVDDLISRLTLEEKVSQMIYASSAIPRLGIPEYNWWNECLHGVARAGIATVFPQAIGMAASFNDKLLYRVACAISDEARAKHHEFVRQGDRGIYKGLTFWSPNINIFRDPRWGRGQETYGEDPYLTGRMGVAFVKGLQGDHPKYLKAIATPKHYAVHSGPEPLRHSFDARVSHKDLRETYLPAFKECVKEGKAESIMGAYNRTNGEPCCASQTLLQKILREEWGFDGYVVSDCGAIHDIHAHHKVTNTPEESAALAVNAGCDLCCGKEFESLVNAVKQGLISEEIIDKAVKRLFKARFKLGMFDPPERVPYAKIPYEVNDCEEHRRLALEMARESMVLLKNEGGLLPLRKDLKAIAVIGPNADNKKVLLGNYNGMPSKYVTALEGIRAKVSPQTKVYYAEGCDLTAAESDYWGEEATRGFAEALAAAQRADVVIMCLGLSPELEGEEGDAARSTAGGDKTSLDLPGIQEELLKAVCATGKPVVLVLFSGSPVSINWAQDNVPAILQAWYPGEEGGTAIADVLFGDYNPGGRLPVTFVKSVEQLPPFTDYSMKGRTYRYMEDEPLYPFGYGLSYTTFEYSNLKLSAEVVEAGQSITISVDVKNTGNMAGDEVVQLYLKDLEASVDVPIHELKGFSRIKLQPGESTTVTFTLTPRQMALIDDDGRCILEPGRFRVMVGGRQPDKRSEALAKTPILVGEFEVRGEAMELEY